MVMMSVTDRMTEEIARHFEVADCLVDVLAIQRHEAPVRFVVIGTFGRLVREPFMVEVRGPGEVVEFELPGEANDD